MTILARSVDYELHDAYHFEDALPEDAIIMSGTGTAHGYGILRWGQEFHNEHADTEYPVAQIDKLGVQLLVVSDAERRWLRDVEIDHKRLEAREKMVRRWNWTLWRDVCPRNHEFLLSLLWIPAEPLSAMEIIARMADQ